MSFISKLFSGSPQSKSNAYSRSAEDASATLDVEKYYALLENLKDWQSKRQFDRMLECCSASMPLLAALVRDCKRDFGSFDLASIPAIEVGCRYWAVINDQQSLRLVAETIRPIPELNEGWAGVVDTAYADAKLALKIRDHIIANPGCLQNKVGEALNESGRNTSRIINTLENIGHVVRTKSGKTYELRWSDH